MTTIADLRNEYSGRRLSEQNASPDPVAQFALWMDEVVKAELYEPTAVTLATIEPDGTPAARIVLLKAYNDQGFCFFTNYNSAKGIALAGNPNASLMFYWPEIHRQVRIKGPVSKMTTEESATYFARRPRGSQISAWASNQSEVIDSRAVLDESMAAYKAKYADGEVPCPEHWGGYRLKHETIEFWQGQANRLHDRLRYKKNGEGVWGVERLAP